MAIKIEKSIVPFIRKQFPAFYNEYGPNFIRFVEEYYKWMEEGGLTVTQTAVTTSNNTSQVTITTSQTNNSNTANVSVSYSGNGTFVPVNTYPNTVTPLKVSNSVTSFFSSNTVVTTSSNSTTNTLTTVTTKDVSGKLLSDSRQILAYKDIDTTVDEFIGFFTNKFLNNIQFNTESSKQKLIKSSVALYSSKGTSQAIELLFQSVFNESVEIYYPGEDILKPSDGRWIKPVYLEVNRTSRNVTLVGKEISGSKSNARAFVENIITRNINGKLLDILYLSNVRGIFLTGDIITENGIILNAPKVQGSLSSLDILTGGSSFKVGEEVNFSSASGVEGKARITSVQTETGKVIFNVEDPGWGYSTTANVTVSEKVLLIANPITVPGIDYDYFENEETVTQPLFRLDLNNVTGDLVIGDLLKNYDGANGVIITVNQTLGQNTASITVNPTPTANLLSNNIIIDLKQKWITVNRSKFFIDGETVLESNGTSNIASGVINFISNTVTLTINPTPAISANGFHVGQFIIQNTTNANGVIKALPADSNMGFSNVRFIVLGDVQGTFNNTNSVTAFSMPGNSTPITVATPNNVTNTFLIQVADVAGNVWESNNILIGTSSGSNSNILVVSDVGGLVGNSLNVSATGKVMATNSTAVGLINTTNTFFSVNGSILVGNTSNTYANITFVSSGIGAGFSIGTITDTETIRLNPEGLTTRNINNVTFSSIFLNGENSNFTPISNVFISNSGIGYNNTNIVVFSGGNSGVGSFPPGNASIKTDNSGAITNVFLTANLGSLVINTPNVSIVNSTGGSTGIGADAILVPVFKYGFVKNPNLDITSPLLDVLTFQEKTIGKIATLATINPGEDYNIDPFVTVSEPTVAVYGRRDILLEIEPVSGAFKEGELIEQSIGEVRLELTSNNFSGNTSGNYEVQELVFTTDGINEVANGNIVSSITEESSNNKITTIAIRNGEFEETIPAVYLTVNNTINFIANDFVQQFQLPGAAAFGVLLSSNNDTLVLKTVSGTFQVNSTPVISANSGGNAAISNVVSSYAFQLFGKTSKGVSNIISKQTVLSETISRGLVYSANDTVLNVRRNNMFVGFTESNTINLIGRTTGALAKIVGIAEDFSSNVAGNNAIINADVVVAGGSVNGLELVDSGFGFVTGDNISLISSENTVATARANVNQMGVGEGYYANTGGFLDDNKYIHDGEYYQEYSYDVKSALPIDLYREMLRLVLHVAGTKQFGQVNITSLANLNINVAESTISIS